MFGSGKAIGGAPRDALVADPVLAQAQGLAMVAIGVALWGLHMGMDAPEGIDVWAVTPFSRVTITRTVGLPRESRISIASMDRIGMFMLFLSLRCLH